MQNPWVDLPETAPFVLPCEKPFIDDDLDALIPINEKKEKEVQEAAKHHVRYTEDGLPRRASLAVQIHWALRQERDRRGQALNERM